MISGVGCDIIETERIKSAVEKTAFRDRVFTGAEQAYCNSRGAHSAESYAACFAAKEAVAKAFGTGVSGFAMTDIEVRHNADGAPYIKLYNNAAAICGGAYVHLSLSHCRDYATAFAVVEKE